MNIKDDNLDEKDFIRRKKGVKYNMTMLWVPSCKHKFSKRTNLWKAIENIKYDVVYVKSKDGKLEEDDSFQNEEVLGFYDYLFRNDNIRWIVMLILDYGKPNQRVIGYIYNILHSNNYDSVGNIKSCNTVTGDKYTAYIGQIHISPSFWGMGLCKKMMKYNLKKLKNISEIKEIYLKNDGGENALFCYINAGKKAKLPMKIRVGDSFTPFTVNGKDKFKRYSRYFPDSNINANISSNMVPHDIKYILER